MAIGISVVLSIPILALLCLSVIILYIFGVPIVMAGFVYFAVKRARYKITQYLEFDKLNLLNMCLSEKTFAVTHA